MGTLGTRRTEGELAVIIPKGTRLELVLHPGESTNIALIWVETDTPDKGWECYTTLPGFNNYGRIATFDVIDTDQLLVLFGAIYEDCRNMDKDAQAAYKAELREMTTTD